MSMQSEEIINQKSIIPSSKKRFQKIKNNTLNQSWINSPFKITTSVDCDDFSSTKELLNSVFSSENDSNLNKSLNIERHHFRRLREGEDFSDLAYALSEQLKSGKEKLEDFVIEVRDEHNQVKKYKAFPIETSDHGVKMFIYIPIDQSSTPVKVIIGSTGTMDKASFFVNIEKNGPADTTWFDCKDDIFKQINRAIESINKPIELVFTGHSLGAGLSLEAKAGFDIAITLNLIEKLRKNNPNSPLLKDKSVLEFLEKLSKNSKYNIPQEFRNNFHWVKKTECYLYNPCGRSKLTWKMGNIAAVTNFVLGGPKAIVNYFISGGDPISALYYFLYYFLKAEVVEVNVAKTKGKLSWEGNPIAWFTFISHKLGILNNNPHHEAKDYISWYSNTRNEDIKKIKRELRGTKSLLFHPDKIPAVGWILAQAVELARMFKAYVIRPILSPFLSGKKEIREENLLTEDMIRNSLNKHREFTNKIKQESNEEVTIEDVLTDDSYITPIKGYNKISDQEVEKINIEKEKIIKIKTQKDKLKVQGINLLSKFEEEKKQSNKDVNKIQKLSNNNKTSLENKDKKVKFKK